MEMMSKTPEEIKKGLECCLGDEWEYLCDECPYLDCDESCKHDGTELCKDALAYIQQLEQIALQWQSSMDQVKKSLQDNGFQTLEELLQAYSQVKRERDAAVEDLGGGKLCGSCKYRDNENKCNGTNCYTCELDCPCAKHPCGFEWRGVREKEENNG